MCLLHSLKHKLNNFVCHTSDLILSTTLGLTNVSEVWQNACISVVSLSLMMWQSKLPFVSFTLDEPDLVLQTNQRERERDIQWNMACVKEALKMFQLSLTVCFLNISPDSMSVFSSSLSYSFPILPIHIMGSIKHCKHVCLYLVEHYFLHNC